MRICALGSGHIQETLVRAAALRGFEVIAPVSEAELIFVAADVLNHDDTYIAHSFFNLAVERRVNEAVPIVVVSQVPPGWTRRVAIQSARPLGQVAGIEANVFYQADTIIVSRAVERMRCPEQFIVGCEHPKESLPLAYQHYLAAHDCPVLQMSYESAEMAKLAINYMLMKQIEAANDLYAAAKACGAEYADVRAAVHGDARIGPHAYLRPGATNQHLDRDVATIRKLLGGK